MFLNDVLKHARASRANVAQTESSNALKLCLTPATHKVWVSFIWVFSGCPPGCGTEDKAAGHYICTGLHRRVTPPGYPALPRYRPVFMSMTPPPPPPPPPTSQLCQNLTNLELEQELYLRLKRSFSTAP